MVCWGAQLAYGEAQVLDKVMYEEEVRREVLSFEQQFHYAVHPPSPFLPLPRWERESD